MKKTISLILTVFMLSSATAFAANNEFDYRYETAAIETSDNLVNKQWALSNDGSFYAEENGVLSFFNKLLGQNKTEEVVAGIDINAEEAFEIYNGGIREVVVAIIDEGIDYTHEDLAGHIWTNNDEIAGNGIDDDRNGYIDDVHGWNFYDNSDEVYTDEEDDHGTHCAGTIIASANNNTGIAGVVQSDKVKVMSVKALGGADGSGSTKSVVDAIKYAEKNGAKICNLSLGTPNNDLRLYNAIRNSNMLFVVAAGNDGQNTDITPEYPAAYDLDNIISVANLNYDGKLHHSSNYGAKSVDIAAPGSYILSTVSDNEYNYMSGSSMSAPFVSAAAALVYSHFKDISLADVKEIILNSAYKLDTLEGTIVTGGMLDLGAALNYDLDTLSGEQWEKPYIPGTPTEYIPPQNDFDQPDFHIPDVLIGLPGMVGSDNFLMDVINMFLEYIMIFLSW